MPSFPFTSSYTDPESYIYTTVNGVLRLEETVLILEYETKRMDGTAKSEVQTCSISLNDVATISFKKKWVKSKVEISTRSLKAIEELKWTKKGSLLLDISKKHNDEARDLVSKVQIELSEKKLRDLD